MEAPLTCADGLMDSAAMAMFDLTGKSALVTGAGSGIGRAIALRFARAGAFVYVTDRDEATARETLAEVEREGKEGVALGLDVADPQAVEQVRGEIEGRWPALSIL